MKRDKPSARDEAGLGEAVAAYLSAEGWDLYHEVTMRGDRCDLVGLREGRVLAVECKVRLNWDVILQAWRWRGVADIVAVAFDVGPHVKAWRHESIHEVLRAAGIAVLTGDRWSEAITAPHGLPVRGRTSNELMSKCAPEHKIFARAGTNGGYASPWAITCRRLREWVSAHPGKHLDEAVDAIDHHYSTDKTARAALATWIRAGKIANVHIDDLRRLYPTPDAGRYIRDEGDEAAVRQELARDRARRRAIRQGRLDLFEKLETKGTP